MIDRSLQVAIQVDDVVYREILRRNGNVESSKDLDDAGARAVLDELRSKGFRDGVKAGSTLRRSAQQPMAKKARALWLALWNLDETETAAETALTAFSQGASPARRISGSAPPPSSTRWSRA